MCKNDSFVHMNYFIIMIIIICSIIIILMCRFEKSFDSLCLQFDSFSVSSEKQKPYLILLCLRFDSFSV